MPLDGPSIAPIGEVSLASLPREVILLVERIRSTCVKDTYEIYPEFSCSRRRHPNRVAHAPLG